ncbi:MAG: nuclear transport factor 2 family protein, partial [Deltaproteobacteria bacterium]
RWHVPIISLYADGRRLLGATWRVRFATNGGIMSTLEIGKKYVALCREGKNEAILDELFAKEAISVEAGAPPGQERTAQGLEAIRGKSKWWRDNHTVHKAELSGPYPHDDRFAVRFVYDITNKPSGKRISMDEVGLFTVSNEKIVKEEFFYTMG